MTWLRTTNDFRVLVSTALRMTLLLAVVGRWGTTQEVGPDAHATAERPAVAPAEDGLAARTHRVVEIPIEGEITPMMEQFFYRKLEYAEALQPDYLVIRIDSPGGYVDAAIPMAERLHDIQWARTVAYVPRSALSGAAILALAADEIRIAPTALLGDAGVVFQDENFLFRHAPEKIRSHLVEQVRGIAAAKGRPPGLAEAMVDMDAVVYEVRQQETNERRWLTEAEWAALPDPDRWQKGPAVFESRAEHFLEVSGTRAVELSLATATAASPLDLRNQLAPVGEWSELPWTTYDTLILALHHPLVTGLLFVVGLIALYVELASPGLGLGGVTATLCFTVFFWSRFLGGTAGWLEVLLFLAGVTFLLLELFVLPGFGIQGATGLALIITSLVLASQAFIIPQTQQDLRLVARSLAVTLGSAVGFLIAAGLLTRRLGSIPLFRNIVLPPAGGNATSMSQDAASERDTCLVDGQPIRLGDQGRAESALRPAGRIRLADTFVDVISDGQFIDPGEWVQVIDVRGNRVVVRRIPPPADPSLPESR